MNSRTRPPVLALVLFTLLAARTAAAPPNIVVLFIDDQGYYDLGCYGATEFETPRIDQLAAQGVRFTDYYAAAPICSPSRAGLLTGCYPRRVGLATWVLRADSDKGIHPDELTLAELLKGAGYATCCVGKWHLGFHDPFLPDSQGFDHYFGLLHNLDPVEVVYFEDQGGVPLMRGRQVVKRPAEPGELVDAYTKEAVDFITAHRDEPFFLYLPHTMAHVPMGVPPRFEGVSNFGLYGDVLEHLDWSTGEILDTIKEQGIADNTIVIYASDNGRGPGRKPSQPIRGRKLSSYEGGIRVPAIAWGPGVGIVQGVESSQVVSALDWYPTLATLAGVRVPEGRVIDGRDISPLLLGETETAWSLPSADSLNGDVPLRRPWHPDGEWKEICPREEYLQAYFEHGSLGALAAVRWDKWKLRLNPAAELYDLEADPGETQPVRNGEILRKLRGMAILFQEEMRTGTRPAGMVENGESPRF